jgi:hypothetical protein
LPDDSSVNAGEQLIKTWSIRNIGTCTWTTDYKLVHDNGNIVSEESITPFTQPIEPNQTAEISIPVSIPLTAGRSETFWYLVSGSDEIVGTNSQGNPYLWLKVDVQPASLLTPTLVGTPQALSSLETPTLAEGTFDLYNNACFATWTNNTNPIPCPEFETDPFASVQLVKNRIFENGETSSNALLFALPESQSGVSVTGTYPQFTVQPNSKLTFKTGCLQNASECSTSVFFYYTNASGSREILWAVTELQDGITSNVSIDLSFLQGQTISIQIEVSSLGESRGDLVLIDSPQILISEIEISPTETATPQPTSTLTPTVTATHTHTPMPTATLEPIKKEEPQTLLESIIQFFKDLFGID